MSKPKVEVKNNYIIDLPKYFPKGHLHAGQPTGFREKLLLALQCPDCSHNHDISDTPSSYCQACSRSKLTPKLHIIKSNYLLWEKWVKDVQADKATITIRQWVGTPYKSKQENIARFDHSSNIAVQKIRLRYGWQVDCPTNYEPDIIAANNGISSEDWQDICDKADRTKPMAVIHLTAFRYT